MRSLYVKIFGIFWLAQSLIFLISTGLIIRQHFPREGVAFEALDAHLLHDASQAADAYQQGGCAAFAKEEDNAVLFNAAGEQLCRSASAPEIGSLWSSTAESHSEQDRCRRVILCGWYRRSRCTTS